MLYVLSVLLVTTIFAYTLWLLTRRRSKGNEPPIVPYWIPWLGSGLQYNKSPIEFLRACEKKYGPIFTVLLAGKFFHFVLDPLTHPAIARESQKLNFRVHTIPLVKKIFDINRPDKLVKTSAGLLPRHLQGKGLERLTETVLTKLDDILSDSRYKSPEWTQSGVLKFCFDVLFPASYRTLYGEKQPNKESFDEMQKIIEDFQKFDEFFPSLVRGYPVSKEFQEVRQRFWNRFSTESLMEKRSGVCDLFREMHELYTSRNEPSGRLSRDAVAYLEAAMANTLVAAFWSLYFTLKHPDALSAAKAEIEEILKSSDKTNNSVCFSREYFSKMPVLDNIIKESLRLGVSPAALREATEDLNIDLVANGKKYKIRKGDKVFAIFQLTHTDPDIYENPMEFKYDRFLSENTSTEKKFYKNGKLVRFNLQPFGCGLSKCPGRYWAMLEIKQFLFLVLSRLDMELTQPEKQITQLQDRIGFGALQPSSDPSMRFRAKVQVA